MPVSTAARLSYFRGGSATGNLRELEQASRLTTNNDAASRRHVADAELRTFIYLYYHNYMLDVYYDIYLGLFNNI